jgi:hypothetical protein
MRFTVDVGELAVVLELDTEPPGVRASANFGQPLRYRRSGALGELLVNHSPWPFVGNISPISSRKRVPLSASSKRPTRSRTAPVNAPRTCPKNSVSYRSRGTAAQLTLTNGLFALLLRRWTSRATSPLPVPFSPRIKTVESVEATRSICRATVWRAELCPISKS